MVGMPRGRSFPLALGIKTLRKGRGLYPRRFNLPTATHRLSGESQSSRPVLSRLLSVHRTPEGSQGHPRTGPSQIRPEFPPNSSAQFPIDPSQRKSSGPGRTPSQGPHPSMPLRNPENKLRPTSATRCCTWACQTSQNAAALRHLSQGCAQLCGIPSRWAFRTSRPHGLLVVRCLPAVSHGSKAFLATGLRCHKGPCPLCCFPFKALRHTGIRAGYPVTVPSCR